MSEGDSLTIFISRDLDPESKLLTDIGSAGQQLVHKSLIRITPIRFSFTPEADWVFFSSKNGIEHFLTQKPELKPGVRFGVISPVSAEYLKTFGKEADYVGQGTDIRKIATDFSKVIKDETVLFPQALNSLQTIQQSISFSNTCFNLYVYKTSSIEDFELPMADILVFTSPSNVMTYFEKYRYQPGQKVIAIGQTTMFRLKSYGVRNVMVPDEFSEEGLLNAILNYIEHPDKTVELS